MSQLHLQESSTTAYLPKPMFGFYLTGVNIKPLKMWHFGKKVIGPVHNLIYNYDDFSEGSHNVRVDIVIIGPDGKLSVIGSSNTVPITVYPQKPKFRVSQTAAIIYKKNHVGISLSTTLTGDQERYSSGDEQITKWTPKNLNHWFRYEKARSSSYRGKVEISGFNGDVKYIDTQDFNVLVCSNDISGSIDIQPKDDNHPGIPDGAYATKRKLTFLANIGQLGESKVYDVFWDFGDGKPGKPGKQVQHEYVDTGNYPVKCTVKLMVENSPSVLILYKTVIIMDPII
ncbi:PKD domain-containing protein [Candidatus Nitrosotenuis chungbukensis]|uniref:PKD domain-containing protein n=1 Tax=Candidatus Nitrosotenuis chungbukensis TaxID=1353246 RepID=UPI0005B28671|nr:PKD domain-containing protein [Candidatus Nitrosotenuis chungbukensis]WKT57184.1 PKD domain-containing protein [Candidatus Nitrosotenuis chungbukensis]